MCLQVLHVRRTTHRAAFGHCHRNSVRIGSSDLESLRTRWYRSVFCLLNLIYVQRSLHKEVFWAGSLSKAYILEDFNSYCAC